MSTRLESFHAKRLENHVQCIFIFTFVCNFFLRVLLFVLFCGLFCFFIHDPMEYEWFLNYLTHGWELNRYYHSGLDLGVIAMMGYSTFSEFQNWSLTIKCSSVSYPRHSYKSVYSSSTDGTSKICFRIKITMTAMC